MNEDVRRAFAFMRRADLAGTRSEPFRWGTAVFDEDLPLRYDSNHLLLERAPADGEALVAEADRLQGGAGLRHRAIVVPDEALGATLEPFFRDRSGWSVDRHLVMVHRRRPERRADVAALVEEVDETALRPPRTREILSQPWGSEEVARTLLAAKTKIAGRVGTRFFAVLEAGEPVSWTDLYVDGGEAQVEDVATAPQRRGVGLATAVVLRAVEAAREAGAGFVFLVADAEDWPRHLYAKLGFDAAGSFFKFIRFGGGEASGGATGARGRATGAS